MLLILPPIVNSVFALPSAKLIVSPLVLFAIVPLVVNAPVFVTLILPPVSVMPVTANVAVLTNDIFPDVLFVALKLVMVLAPPNVVPVAELVARAPSLTNPAPLSEIAPVDVKVAVLLLPGDTVPVKLISPVFVIVVFAAALCVMPVRVNVVAVFVN